MSRPEALFPLFADLETLDGVGPKTAQAFTALGVAKPKDLLYLLPHSTMDRSRKASIREVVAPTTVTVEVEVGLHIPPRQKGRPYRVLLRVSTRVFPCAGGVFAKAFAHRPASSCVRKARAF
jgi:ATP-dependent DNA helicase RecG